MIVDTVTIELTQYSPYMSVTAPTTNTRKLFPFWAKNTRLHGYSTVVSNLLDHVAV